MFPIKTTIEKEMWEHIRYAYTPEDAWDTLASRFLKKNDMQLQMLKNELMSAMQSDMSINQYFTKKKNLLSWNFKVRSCIKNCWKKKKRMITYRLKPKNRGFIMAI